VVLALKVTRLFVVGSDVAASVASFSAASAAVAEGATNEPWAFCSAAVGRFQTGPSGSPVHTDAIGMMAPSAIFAATVPGTLLAWFRAMSLPSVVWSPPEMAVCGNGQDSVGMVLVVLAPLFELSPAAKLDSDAGVLSKRFSRASFSMVGSRFPHFEIASWAAAQEAGAVSLESAQLEYCGEMLP
jgi:hypothetical protein